MGCKKGNIPWNKGKKGCQTAWNKGMKGYNSNYPRSEEWKNKIRLSNIGKKKPSLIGNKHTLGVPAWNKGLEGFLGGKRHYNWKGGISPIADRYRKSRKYKNWKEKVFSRDNFSCQKCKEQKKDIQAHHIIPMWQCIVENKSDLIFDVSNGITLCIAHHIEETFRGR